MVDDDEEEDENGDSGNDGYQITLLPLSAYLSACLLVCLSASNTLALSVHSERSSIISESVASLFFLRKPVHI